MSSADGSFPTVTFDPDAPAASAATLEKIEGAVALFREHGAVRLHGVFQRPFVDELLQHYRARYRLELLRTSKDDRRPLFTVDLSGPFARPAYYAHPIIFPIVERLLGTDCALGACSTVISFPGAPQQFIHRDSPSLFGDFAHDVRLPPYALTVLMPLVDANALTGSTRVWPGSHRVPDLQQAQALPSESPDVPFGSALMTDSRVVHCGSPNVSDRVRPLLYNSYHRGWFRDWGGYEQRPPVNLAAAVRRTVPERHASLFRIADESRGEPEGPLDLAARLERRLPPSLRRILRSTRGART